ncbi:hypothetical protein ACWEN3_43410, partial [Streptomyces sp. NPDC004561]
MDAQSYSTALADLRTLRDQIKKTRAALAKQEADRDKLIVQLASYAKAKAERIAPAAGLGVADVVALAPALAPDSLTTHDAPQSPAAGHRPPPHAARTGPASPSHPVPR